MEINGNGNGNGNGKLKRMSNSKQQLKPCYKYGSDNV